MFVNSQSIFNRLRVDTSTGISSGFILTSLLVAFLSSFFKNSKSSIIDSQRLMTLRIVNVYKRWDLSNFTYFKCLCIF